MVKPDQDCDHFVLPPPRSDRRVAGGGGVQGAGKLKGFFYLFLNQLSTMQEIITGDKTGGGREKERKRGGGGG